MTMFGGIFHRDKDAPDPDVPRVCRACGADITKPPGFWNMWRAAKPVAGDPEYCPSGGNHAHKPI